MLNNRHNVDDIDERVVEAGVVEGGKIAQAARDREELLLQLVAARLARLLDGRRLFIAVVFVHTNTSSGSWISSSGSRCGSGRESSRRVVELDEIDGRIVLVDLVVKRQVVVGVVVVAAA